MSRITVKNLYHTYQPGTPFMQAALEDISLDIGSGELVGIIEIGRASCRERV